MNRIDDGNYKNYFRFNQTINSSRSKLSQKNPNLPNRTSFNPTMKTPMSSRNGKKRLAYQILNTKSRARHSFENRNESLQSTQRILNVEPFRNKNIFNGNKPTFSRIKHASVDFSSMNKARQNPLFSKRNLRNLEKIKKYQVTKDEFRKFKIAGNFQKKKKRSSRENDLKYFGMKKASRIKLVSNKSKMSSRGKGNPAKRALLQGSKPRYSHSPQRTKKHNFTYFGKQPVLTKQQSLMNNPATRVMIQTSGDSFGSAVTNVWSSNSPKSAGNNANPVMVSRNATQQLITESIQDHQNHPRVYQSNQNIGTQKIMLTNSIRSVSQSHNNFSLRDHKNPDLLPNRQRQRHRRMHSFQQNPEMFKRSDSIQSSRSCNRSVKSKSLRKFVKSFRKDKVKLHQRPKKHHFNGRRVSNITRTGKFVGDSTDQVSIISQNQQPLDSYRSVSNQSVNSVNKIFKRIQNLTERIANKNHLQRKDSRGSNQRLLVGGHNVYRTQSNYDNSHQKYQKKGPYRGNKPKNEYFTTPLKGKQRRNLKKKEKISNYRNKFMKGWQELRSKGKSLKESQIDDRKIVKAIQANSGRKRLFKDRDAPGPGSMLDGIWEEIDSLLFVMELNNQVGLGKS